MKLRIKANAGGRKENQRANKHSTTSRIQALVRTIPSTAGARIHGAGFTNWLWKENIVRTLAAYS